MVLSSLSAAWHFYGDTNPSTIPVLLEAPTILYSRVTRVTIAASGTSIDVASCPASIAIALDITSMPLPGSEMLQPLDAGLNPILPLCLLFTITSPHIPDGAYACVV